jgi:hypothetical protein
MTDRVEQFLEESADGHGVQDYSAAVDALVATGVLSPERAEQWKERAESWKAVQARLRTSGSGRQGPYDEEIEAKATQLLEDLFAPVRPRASEDWDLAVYLRYQEALSTLTAIGALSPEHARPWLARQQQALTPAGGWAKPEPDPEMRFGASALSAVVAGPSTRLDGMRVTCLELYGDCVVVRFHQLLPEEPADPVERREYLQTSFELQDDAGTEYGPVAIPTPRGCKPRKVKGWPEVLSGWQAFVPGAPLDARAFTVGWRDCRFELALDAPRLP